MAGGKGMVGSGSLRSLMQVGPGTMSLPTTLEESRKGKSSGARLGPCCPPGTAEAQTLFSTVMTGAKQPSRFLRVC